MRDSANLVCFFKLFITKAICREIAKMLVLSRKLGERLFIGEDIVLIVNKIAGNRVTLAIEAPNHVRIVRGELSPLPQNAGANEPSVCRIDSHMIESPGPVGQPVGDLGIAAC
jgi:carbon storage regulator